MKKQKIIKVGNSLAITLPIEMVREGGWKVGDELLVEQNSAKQMVFIHSKKSNNKKYLTPEFFDWLTTTSNKYEEAIKELAKE